MPLSAGDLAGCLLSVGAVRLQPLDPFTWASGLKSPIYCDNRQLLGVPEVRDQIIEALTAKSAALHPTLIAGAATAGFTFVVGGALTGGGGFVAQPASSAISKIPRKFFIFPIKVVARPA